MTSVMETEDPYSARRRMFASSATVVALAYLWWGSETGAVAGISRSIAPWIFFTIYTSSVIAAVLSFADSWFPNRFLHEPWGTYRVPFSTAKGLQAKRISVAKLLAGKLETFKIRTALLSCYEATSELANFVFLPLACVLPGGWVARRGDLPESVVMVVDQNKDITEYVPSVGLPRRFYDPSSPQPLSAAKRAERLAKKPFVRPQNRRQVEHRFGADAQVVDFTFAIGSVLASAAWHALR